MTALGDKGIGGAQSLTNSGLAHVVPAGMATERAMAVAVPL